MNAVQKNTSLFKSKDYESACAFIEHAEGFERSSYERTEGVPRFPEQLEAMIVAYAQ